MRARLLVIAAAVLFSTGGVALKADAFDTAQMSALRSGIAAIVLLLWIGGVPRPGGLQLAVATLYAATVTLFVAATRLTTAGGAIFLQSAAPLYIALLGPVLLGERSRRRDLWFLLPLMAGLALCVTGTPDASHTAPDPARGTLFGVLSGVTWALTLMALRHAGRTAGSVRAGLSGVALGNAVACVVAVPFAWPLPPAPLEEWVNVIYLGTAQIALAYVCLVAAARQLPAIDMSLLLLLEPVLNPLWSWWLLDENPGRATLAGGALILAATAIRALQQIPRPDAPLPAGDP